MMRQILKAKVKVEVDIKLDLKRCNLSFHYFQKRHFVVVLGLFLVNILV